MRDQVLVCTANDPNGWCHGTTTSHYDRTVTLDIYRIADGGKIEHHPASGKVWKYGKASDRMAALDAIQRVTDKIGLAVGSLKVYVGR